MLAEKGELNFEGNFLSLRILKESLSENFKFKVLEESSKCLSCRILRMARLFGAPVPFPNPILDLEIVSDQNEHKLKYQFLSYDYHLLFLAIVFINLSFGIGQIRGSNEFPFEFFELIGFSLLGLLLGSFAIKLDSLYFTHLIKKSLKKNIGKTKRAL